MLDKFPNFPVKWFFTMWIFSLLASIGITIGVIYVVIHFVSKYW